MSGYSFKCDHIFYVFFRKHYCPKCLGKLSRKTVSHAVNSASPLAKKYDFNVADISVKGDILFSHIEFYCNECNRYYTVKEAKNNKF